MRYVLENTKLRVEIDSFGAEVKSVKAKDNGPEYMWQADKKYWGRTSPVLFPFVGSMKNKEFLLNGKAYPMGQHGFARDMEFDFVSQSDTEITFELKSNDETMAKYPFAFALRIGYVLEGNTLKVVWEAMNPASEVLPFSIGAHPAFNCPLYGEENKAGYMLSFEKFTAPTENTNLHTVIPSLSPTEKVVEIHHHGSTRDTGLALTEDLILELTDGKCTITPEFFDRTTYFVENNQANKVSILDPAGNEYVSVIFDTPLFAVWSPEEKNAPFLCIEPWYGRADHVDFSGDLHDRLYTNLLKGGETFYSEYIITFGGAAK